jgi:hypothetical protein
MGEAFTLDQNETTLLCGVFGPGGPVCGVAGTRLGGLSAFLLRQPLPVIGGHRLAPCLGLFVFNLAIVRGAKDKFGANDHLANLRGMPMG